MDELRLVTVTLPEDAIEKEFGSMELGFGLWRGTLFAQGEREMCLQREREREMAAIRVKGGGEEREDVGKLNKWRL